MSATQLLGTQLESRSPSDPLRRPLGDQGEAAVREFVRQRVEALANPPRHVVNDRVVFHENWSLAVPAASGCYIISDMRGPLYVGRSGSLRQRFIEHLKRSHNVLLRRALENPWGTPEFSWVLHDNEGLPAAETWLIVSLQPICNQNNIVLPVNPAAAGRS